jgi:hypothetical protein
VFQKDKKMSAQEFYKAQVSGRMTEEQQLRIEFGAID